MQVDQVALTDLPNTGMASRLLTGGESLRDGILGAGVNCAIIIGGRILMTYHPFWR